MGFFLEKTIALMNRAKADPILIYCPACGIFQRFATR